MAVGMIMRLAGGGVGQEHDDAVMRELGLPLGDAGGNWPAALISHAAGSAPDGSWVVVDVWQSQQASDQFLASDLGPAFARAGDLPSRTWPRSRSTTPTDMAASG